MLTFKVLISLEKMCKHIHVVSDTLTIKIFFGSVFT